MNPFVNISPPLCIYSIERDRNPTTSTSSHNLTAVFGGQDELCGVVFPCLFSFWQNEMESFDLGEASRTFWSITWPQREKSISAPAVWYSFHGQIGTDWDGAPKQVSRGDVSVAVGSPPPFFHGGRVESQAVHCSILLNPSRQHVARNKHRIIAGGCKGGTWNALPEASVAPDVTSKSNK